MKIQKIIRGIEVGLYLALGMYGVKTISSIVIGYLTMKPNMGGLPFYYWRKEYSNSNAAKNSYGFIDPNTEDDTELFRTFSSIVQPMYNEKSLKSKKEDLEAVAKKYKDSKFFSYKSENALKELEKVEEKLKSAKYTSIGLTPLYSVGGSDSFVLGPKKTFKIFKTKGDSYNKAAFDSEMEFLAFRHVFLKYLMMNNMESDYDKKEKLMKMKEPKNWVPLKKSLIEKFFASAGRSPIEFGSAKQVELSNGEKISVSTVKITSDNNETAEVKLLESHAKAVENYISAYGDFNKLFDMLENSEGLVQFEEGKTKVDEELSDLAWTISSKIGLSKNFDNKREVFDEEFSGFITRSALIKPNAFDVHLMNRLHYIYLMLNSEMDPEGLDEKYNELKKKGEEFHQKLEATDFSTASDSVIKELVAKKTLNVEKMRKRRVGLIFNDFSQKMAKNLGNKGYFLKSSEEDERLPVFKLFAYPGIYESKDKKNIGSVFSKSEPTTA